MQYSFTFFVFATSLCSVSAKVKECSEYYAGEANKRFTFEMYFKAMQNSAPNGNFIVAPKIIASALTMLAAGAGDIAKRQIFRGLEIDSTSLQFTESDYPCLLGIYENPYGNDTSVGAYEPRNASRLFGETTVKFSKSYLRTTGIYGPKMKRLNFSGNPLASRRRINRWVSNKTGQNIGRLFSKNDVTSDTTLVLASAAYFKGYWKFRFPHTKTHMRKFWINDTHSVETEFMRTNADFYVYYDSYLGGSLVALPYEVNGDSESLYMVTMHTGDWPIERMQQRMTSEKIQPAMSNLFGGGRNYDILLPKFKIRSKFDLRPMLEGLAITDIFDQTRSDFSGMKASNSDGGRRLSVGAAVHEAVLEVDETGGYARANNYGWGSGVLTPQFVVFKPFIVMIYDKSSDTILFIGKVTDPTAE